MLPQIEEPYDPSVYPPFAVTVDLVVLTVGDHGLSVLAVRRGGAGGVGGGGGGGGGGGRRRSGLRCAPRTAGQLRRPRPRSEDASGVRRLSGARAADVPHSRRGRSAHTAGRRRRGVGGLVAGG